MISRAKVAQGYGVGNRKEQHVAKLVKELVEEVFYLEEHLSKQASVKET